MATVLYGYNTTTAGDLSNHSQHLKMESRVFQSTQVKSQCEELV